MARKKSSGSNRGNRGQSRGNRSPDFDLIDDETRAPRGAAIPDYEADVLPALSFDDYDPVNTIIQQRMAIARMKREQQPLRGVVHSAAAPLPTLTHGRREKRQRVTNVIEPDNPRDYTWEAREPSRFQQALDEVMGCKKRPEKKKRKKDHGKGGGRAFIPWC